jgi:hypothetical protein
VGFAGVPEVPTIIRWQLVLRIAAKVVVMGDGSFDRIPHHRQNHGTRRQPINEGCTNVTHDKPIGLNLFDANWSKVMVSSNQHFVLFEPGSENLQEGHACGLGEVEEEDLAISQRILVIRLNGTRLS